MSNLGLYIHIPFCKQKCNYCDFVSYAGKDALIDDYVEALIHELKTSPLSSPAANSFPSPSKMERGAESEGRGGVRTIYFGGGTPTLLKPAHFEKILSSLNPCLPAGTAKSLILNPEISIEANPGTVDRAYLKALRSLGINRLSLGAQSFNDKHLKYLGRIHNSRQIYHAYEDARNAGFDNINLDLIFAIPGQTLDEWKEDLNKALNLGPEHLSTYNLQIEEGTPLWKMTNIQKSMTNKLPTPNTQLPTEDTDADMYEYTIEKLSSNGFKHYEISNFARPGKECQHNINYWKMGNWIGIGAGAHSHVDGKHWANTDSVEAYIGGGGVERNVIRQTATDSPNATAQRETIFMGLRLLDGINKSNFVGFEVEVQSLKKDGLLEEAGDNIRLTKKGIFLGNLVFEKFV